MNDVAKQNNEKLPKHELLNQEETDTCDQIAIKIDEEEKQPKQIKKITIKFLDGRQQEVELFKYMNGTILDLKKDVFADYLSNNKIVRLIYSGRLLKDNEKINTLNIQEGCFIHTSIIDDPNKLANNNLLLNPNNQPISAYQSNDAYNHDYPNSRLNEDEIRQLQQYIEQINQMQQNIQQQHENSEALAENQNYQQTNQGTKFEFIVGIIIGFIFNILGLIIIFSCFSCSRNAKNGVILGFIVRLFYALMFAARTTN